MKAFSIFDDFPQSSIDILKQAGVLVDLLPKGQTRPSGIELKRFLDLYDIIFISTAQQMPEDMFADINTPKIIGTASSGIDHVHIPRDKQHFIKIANATHANRTTVTEHTFGLILTLRKRLIEGRRISLEGKSKKEMQGKPIDLFGSTMGVIGAGGIASTVLRMAKCFGMNCLCWTLHPEHHPDLSSEGVRFVNLETLLSRSDVVSVNIPLSEHTQNLVSSERVAMLKDNAVFVTTSRIGVIDKKALFAKAHHCKDFGLGMDIDASDVMDLWSPDMDNVIITPHIGGGTVESRIRLFDECCENVVKQLTIF